jgi:DNA-binding NarL/FixJ family response regulator
MRIRVLVVDDHAFIRTMVTGVLHRADDILVVGECGDGAEVPAMAASVCPDVVLMDIRMPITSGTTATRELLSKHPAIRVIMLTMSMNTRIVTESAKAGAVGFLIKDKDRDLLVTAVRTVAAGGIAWPGDPLLVH